MKYFIALFAIAITVGACTGMDEEYKKFLSDSDILYPGKVDSIRVKSGINRIQFRLLVSSDPKVKKMVVYWNGRLKNKEFDISANEIGKYKDVSIAEIEEGVHNFEFFTFDTSGNSSISTEQIGVVYGKKYEARVSPRDVQSIINSAPNEVMINWGAYNTLFYDVNVTISYEAVDGSMQTVNVPKNDTKTVLSNYKSGKALKMTTYVRPDATCLDEFKTQTIDGHVYSYLDADKIAFWKIHRFSSDRPSDPVKRCIDGIEKGNGFWVTNTSVLLGYPHWVVLDLGKLTAVDAFYLVQRYDSYPNPLKNMKIFVHSSGNDDKDWVEIASATLLSSADRQIVPLNKKMDLQFVKFEFYNDWGNSLHLSLMEIGALNIW